MEFEKMQDVFHIYQLKRYIPDERHVLEPERVQIDSSLTYEERPVKIFDRKMRSTRNKDFGLTTSLKRQRGKPKMR